MSCPLCAKVEDALAGRGEPALAIWPACVVFLGENQGCPGWCVVVTREHVEHLDDVPVREQGRLFEDVAVVARAIRAAFPQAGAGGGPVRINYECLGNVVPHAHWHVVPRHADDPTPRAPVWGWTPERLRGAMTTEERAALHARMAKAIDAAERETAVERIS